MAEGSFSSLSNSNKIEKEHNKGVAYLSDFVEGSNIVEYYLRKIKKDPIIYQLAKDILTYPSYFRGCESFFSGLSNIVTKKRNKHYSVTIQMLVTVRNVAEILRLGDVVMSIESGNEEMMGDAGLRALPTMEANLQFDDVIKVYIYEGVELMQ